MAFNTREKIYAITGSNLQLCFVNEHHQANESSDNDTVRKFSCFFCDLIDLLNFFKNSIRLKNSKSDDVNSITTESNDEDILSKQQRLKEEAKVALVLGAKMARMQVQIERRALKKKKSPLYDIVCYI